MASRGKAAEDGAAGIDMAAPKSSPVAPPRRGGSAIAKPETLRPASKTRQSNGKSKQAKPPPAGGPTRRSTPREKNDATERRILDAAIFEFSEHGFAGARIERISQRAETVDRMLYYYFGNKERLYQAVLDKVYADMIGAQRDFVMPDDPVDGMRQLVEHSWDHYVAHPDLVRILMNENLLRGAFVNQSEQLDATTLPLVQTVSTLLANGKARGVFRADISSEHVLMTIMSLGFFYVSNQYTCSRWIGANLMTRPRRGAWREHIVEVVMDSLRPRDASAGDDPTR
jgi:AcrR family transcriptional regulator